MGLLEAEPTQKPANLSSLKSEEPDLILGGPDMRYIGKEDLYSPNSNVPFPEIFADAAGNIQFNQMALLAGFKPWVIARLENSKLTDDTKKILVARYGLNPDISEPAIYAFMGQFPRLLADEPYLLNDLTQRQLQVLGKLMINIEGGDIALGTIKEKLRSGNFKA